MFMRIEPVTTIDPTILVVCYFILVHVIFNPRKTSQTLIIKPGDEFLRLAKAKARRGEQPRDYEQQLGASGGGRSVRCAPGPGEIKGTCAPKGTSR